MDVSLARPALIAVFALLGTITLVLLERGPVRFVRRSVRSAHLLLFVPVAQLDIG